MGWGWGTQEGLEKADRSLQSLYRQLVWEGKGAIEMVPGSAARTTVRKSAVMRRKHRKCKWRCIVLRGTSTGSICSVQTAGDVDD